MLFLFLPSCQRGATVVLSPFTESIVNMYISSDTGERGDVIIVSASQDIGKMAYVNIDAPPADIPTFGTYCGYTYQKGYRVEVWGSSVSGFFWKSTETAVVIEPPKSYIFTFYDPCDWDICIDMADTTIAPWLSYFPCGFPYPLDTLQVLINNNSSY